MPFDSPCLLVQAMKSRIQKMEKTKSHRRKQRKRGHKKKGKAAVAMAEEDMQEYDEAGLRQLVQDFQVSLKVTDRGYVVRGHTVVEWSNIYIVCAIVYLNTAASSHLCLKRK